MVLYGVRWGVCFKILLGCGGYIKYVVVYNLFFYLVKIVVVFMVNYG